MQKQVNDVSRASFAKLSNMYKIRKYITEDGAKTICTYYDNIWTWLLQQPLLWPTWLSPRKTLLCSKIRCQIDNPNWQVWTHHPSFHCTSLASYQREMWIQNPSSYLKCFNGLAPTYLEELLHKRPDCESHGNNDNLLIVPKVNRVTFGGIAFKRADPDLWNSIFSSLRKKKTIDIFKSGLKTLLFKRAFNL